MQSPPCLSCAEQTRGQEHARQLPAAIILIPTFFLPYNQAIVPCFLQARPRAQGGAPVFKAHSGAFFRLLSASIRRLLGIPTADGFRPPLVCRYNVLTILGKHLKDTTRAECTPILTLSRASRYNREPKRGWEAKGRRTGAPGKGRVQSSGGAGLRSDFAADAGRRQGMGIKTMTRREILQAAALALSGLASASKAPADTPTRFAVADDGEFFGALDPRRPALAAVKQAADAQNWARAKTAWAAHLTGCAGRGWPFRQRQPPPTGCMRLWEPGRPSRGWSARRALTVRGLPWRCGRCRPRPLAVLSVKSRLPSASAA